MWTCTFLLLDTGLGLSLELYPHSRQQYFRLFSCSVMGFFGVLVWFLEGGRGLCCSFLQRRGLLFLKKKESHFPPPSAYSQEWVLVFNPFSSWESEAFLKHQIYPLAGRMIFAHGDVKSILITGSLSPLTISNLVIHVCIISIPHDPKFKNPRDSTLHVSI